MGNVSGGRQSSLQSYKRREEGREEIAENGEEGGYTLHVQIGCSVEPVTYSNSGRGLLTVSLPSSSFCLLTPL
jgi:hypothetical protein